MSLLSRLRDALDAPRFCPDDGQPIEVEDIGAFDPRTGEKRERWVWHCPDVRVSDDARTFSQIGDSVHVHGYGRPRWHEDAKEEA